METTTNQEGNMSVNACITNNLARVVGLIANKHQECSVEIQWREGTPEQEWIVTASDGRNYFVYVVDDESGTWMPLNKDELARLSAGKSILADADEDAPVGPWPEDEIAYPKDAADHEPLPTTSLGRAYG